MPCFNWIVRNGTLAAVLPVVLDVTVETPDYTHLTLKVSPPQTLFFLS
jgi:hypothetical protein